MISEAKEEQSSLREELKTTFDELTYVKLSELDATLGDNAEKLLGDIPAGIYVG